MGDNRDDIDEQFDDMYDSIKEPASRGAINLGKSLSKKLAKASVYAFKAAVKLIITAFSGLIIPILIFGSLGFFILFEFVGTEKQYSYKYDNEVEINEEGIGITSEDKMEGENKVIKDFYKFFAGQSYHQIIGNKKELVGPDDKDAVKDYYNREELYKLTPNFLFTLDRDVYDSKWKYPEQFIKPVYYDEEKLELKHLREGEEIIATSDSINLKTGKKTGKKVQSVKDYGLASILAYNQSQDWKETHTMKGRYDKKEVWDEASQSKRMVAVDEPFPDVIITEDDIHLIEKIVNFRGEKSLAYEYQETRARSLSGQGIEAIEVEYASFYKMETVIDEFGVETQVQGERISLKKYKSADSGIFRKIPVIIEEPLSETGEEKEEEELEQDYLVDYLSLFETDIPEGTTRDFEFEGRIDYDSYIFDEDGMLKDTGEFALGSKAVKGNGAFENTLQYMKYIEASAAEFGTDPYVILAMLSLESGGGTSNGDGIAQISGFPIATTTDKDGRPVKIKVTNADKQDPARAIRFATAYYKQMFDKYQDVYKAITAYNMPALPAYIEEKYPETKGNSLEWLIYREEARIYYGKKELGVETRSAQYSFFSFPQGVRTKAQYPRIYGNSNYLEMVLQYYDKKGASNMDYTNVKDAGFFKSAASSLGGMFKDFLNKIDKTKDIEYVYYENDLSDDRINDLLLTTSSLDNQTLFSETTKGGSLSFWEEGFKDMLGFGLSGQKISSSSLKSVVDKYLGIPYVWGGKTTAGLDCSGFTYLVFKDLGIDIGHGTHTQKEKGERVAYTKVSDLLPGDLIFYGESGEVSHVAIYMGDGIRAHAPQTGDVVKYDRNVTGSTKKPIINVQRHAVSTGVNSNDMPNKDGFISPLLGGPHRISSHFNPNRIHPVTHVKRPHKGTDIPKPTGTPVYASKEGVVTHAAMYGGGGKTIMIKHGDGVQTIYMHLSAYKVKSGDKVAIGQQIGNVGNTGASTGAHLHFEYRKNGVALNAINIINQ